MYESEPLINEPRNYINNLKRINSFYVFYICYFIIILGFIINNTVFFYYIPKEINLFKSQITSMSSTVDSIKEY